MTLLLAALPETALATNVEDSLVLGIQSTKTLTIDPLQPLERDMKSIYGVVYESLIRIDDDYNPQPYLCESWEIGNGGKTWTFHLRENVTFSDGTPLTASDVVATIDAILEKANQTNATDYGYYRNLAYYVSSASATNDTTLIIRTASGRRYWGLLYELTFPVLKASEVNSENPVGTGPYVITSFDPCSYMLLEVNTRWWQQLPQVKQISVVMADTATAVMENFQYARVDAVLTRSLSASQVKSGTTTLNVDARTNVLETLVMNTTDSYLSDINVRYAIRYAIDVDQLLSDNYMGMGSVTNTMYPQGTWMYDENLTNYYSYDPEKSRELLAESGWADVDEDGVLDKLKEDGSGYYRLHLRLYVYEEPDNSVRIETANDISDALAAVGIEATVSVMTMTNMSSYLSNGSFDMALVAYAMDPCPDPGFLLMKSNTGNYARYNSDAMNEYCKTLRTCLDQESYQQQLYQIQALYLKDCPFICLYYRNAAVLTRKMFTTARDVRELEMLRGIETFPN